MHVIDLEGNQYPLKATVKQEYELNGNQNLETTITPNKVNSRFIKDISQMWSIVDFDGVEHKVVFFKKAGKGDKLTVDIKAIPLFFHAFNNDRIYEKYDEHMTAQAAFDRIFAGTKFDFVIHGTFKAVEWQGFGDGEPRLETFKRAIERYKAEFELIGNTVHLKNLVGRDTQFQYRYKLNASNIMQEVDASDMWTYARGYGDYGDGSGGEDWQDAKLVREYTSPLAKIPGIGKLHAPPIKNGKITDVSTMDKDLKTLVNESLKISVNATLHDLRKQNYPLAQPQKGDRVFLIDDRIDFDQEIRIVFIAIVKDWKGNVLDLSADFGDVNLSKRHQSNIKTAIKNVQDIISGNKELPYDVLDKAVKNATESLESAMTELIFDNGIIAREKNDPNKLVLLNSKGVGISDDGGGTFREAITADGFVLSAGAIGRLEANHIQLGRGTEFDDGYDPSEKETPAGAQDKVNDMKKQVDNSLTDLGDYIDVTFKDGVIEEAEAKAIEKYINTLNTEKDEVDAKYSSIYTNPSITDTAKTYLRNSKINLNGAHSNLIEAINAAISDGKTTSAEKADVDSKFILYRAALSSFTERFEQAIDSVTQTKADEAEYWAKEYAKDIGEDLNVDIVRHGTNINEAGVYTGEVVANQVKTGIMTSQNNATLFNLNNGDLQFNHSDGTYTKIGRNGMERFVGTDQQHYHYLFHAVSFVYGKSDPNSARWIQLPDDFKGKDFKVYFAIADSLNAPNYHYAIQRFVCTVHPNYSINKTRARVPVIAYKSSTKSDGVAPKIEDVQGVMFAIY